MTEEKEINQSSEDKSEPVNNDPVAMKMEITSEKVIKDMNNIEDKEEAAEEDQGEEDKKEMEEQKVEGDVVEEEVEEERGEEEETESEEDTEDERENKLDPGPVDVSIDGEKVLHMEASLQKNPDGREKSPMNGLETSKSMHANEVPNSPHVGDKSLPEALVENNVGANKKPAVDDVNGFIRPDTKEGHDAKLKACDSLNDKRYGDETMSRNRSSLEAEHMNEELKNEAKIKEGSMNADGGNASEFSRFDFDTSGGGESGTEEEQAAFVMELYKFHKERSLDFRPPKFYGEPLNLLKLWRAVLKLGGYDKVTAFKYWRQVGESFNPPKTCTTISWTFRVFYEKALLDYERFRGIDSSNIPDSFAVADGAENQASALGRARRESAARAMQGWHSQRNLDNGEVGDPIIKDKSSISSTKKEKQLKNLGIPKRKKPSTTDHAMKPAQTKFPKTQIDTTVIDIGSPADWVKINVRATKDCYEVYALVPGLLREEVRVQSDPAGRLVISGEPENPDNPWSVTPFKKVVSLPSRIDPHQTSAVVTLHGQLFVRVPFEQYD